MPESLFQTTAFAANGLGMDAGKTTGQFGFRPLRLGYALPNVQFTQRSQRNGTGRNVVLAFPPRISNTKTFDVFNVPIPGGNAQDKRCVTFRSVATVA